MNISAYSIKNPLVAIFYLDDDFGNLWILQMKIQQFPDIDLPGVVTTITLAGASPDQLENDVAKKLKINLPILRALKAFAPHYKQVR